METSPAIHRIYQGMPLFVAIAVFLAQPSARALETDQFLLWDRELRDSAEPLNRFFNDEILNILETRNDAIEQTCYCPDLVEDIFHHLFKKRRMSLIKKFLRNSEEVHLFPDRSVSNYRYRNMSIYRDITFPYLLPLSRTLRVGDVYFGIDKLAHMFGYGSKYYKRYLRHIRYGATEQKAMKRIVRYGIITEKVLVGEYLDGVFAHADLEANFQGFMLSRDMCQGADPFLVLEDEKWRLTRPVDLRTYITPDFDESYNLSHWQADRKREVLIILREEYFEKRRSPRVQERFTLYRQRPPSESKRIIEEFFQKKGVQPQMDQSLAAFDAPPGSISQDATGDF